MGSKVQRFYLALHDTLTISVHSGEPQNPKNLQNPFMLAMSFLVTLFLNLTALPMRGRLLS